MAGAACARLLADHGGLAVTLFDKGRSVGGRLAQRRIGDAVFDHGAQYMAVRDPAFQVAADGWAANGLAVPWPGAAAGDGGPVLVGVPAMNAPVKALLAGLDVRVGHAVEEVERRPDGWAVRLGGGTWHGGFAALLLAVPAPQTIALLGTAGVVEAAAMAACLDDVRIAPCWAGMLAFTGPVPLDGPGRRVEDPALAWAGHNPGKPGRGTAECWTVHARPEWSAERLELAPEAVAPLLLEAFARITRDRGSLPPATLTLAHRWRYALVTRALGEPALWDAAAGLGICGDWCLGPRVECAYLSGKGLAELILA
jgi:predicted NAD/FAD-dependent oxidoreductase